MPRSTINVPYASASTGQKAREEISKILRRLGCESVGFMDEYATSEVLLAFTHRGRSVQLRASAKGWAQLYLKVRPWTGLSPHVTARLRTGGAQARPHRGQLDPARLDKGAGHRDRMRHPVL